MSSVKDKLKQSNFIMNCYRLFRMGVCLISPTLATKMIFRISMGRKLDLNNPQTLDEKISYLKLNDYLNNPLITKCADKYLVREYIEDCGCGEILNELYGAYDDIPDIPWDDLPQRFALKYNNGCGCNIICSDKTKLDIKKAIKQLKKWKRKNYYLSYAEMQYKGIKKKIICEKFLENRAGAFPDDYKFYCLNGKAEYVMICTGREHGHPKFYYYNKAWELQPFSQDALDAGEDFHIEKPNGIDELFKYAEKLSKPFPFVRADFYLLDGKPIFGELTFTPSGGIDSGRLPKTDELLGSMLKL